LELYLVWGNILADSNEFIFRNLTKCKDMYILRRDDQALSYSRMRELFIQAFQSFIHTIVPSAEIKEWVKPIFIYFSSCENNELKSYRFNTL
jgi:hypothetical protein